MTNINISKSNSNIKTEITLPSSKSISNRVLIIKELCSENFNINNLSDSDDTKLLLEILNNVNNHKDNSILKINVNNAGTVLRFLTAYLAIKPKQNYLLECSKRMTERPIGDLVNALNTLGTQINYENSIGFPPLSIKGKKISKSNVKINSEVSSQFISSLILIAPTLEKGLKISLTGKTVSIPYIEMTLKIAKHFGIEYKFIDDIITIENQNYKAKDFTVEADWSAASYWYMLAAISNNAEIKINGLNADSCQGDKIITEIFQKLGVKTEYFDNYIIISKHKNNVVDEFKFNFSNYPDIAMPVIIACAVLKVKTRFVGLKNLKIKESDRLNAVKTELIKFGIDINLHGNDSLSITPSNLTSKRKKMTIKTYNDHRVIMSFAPLAMFCNSLAIRKPNDVDKSYPNFFNDLQNAGFIIIDNDNTCF